MLSTIRSNTGRPNPLSLKNIDKATGKLARCTSCWLQVGVAALMQRFKGKRCVLPTGADGPRAEFLPLAQPIAARFILFRIKGGLESLKLCPDYAAKVETTFRMAFKGGLTMFSNEGDELCIRSLHFDGYRHHKRRLDLQRLLRNVGDPPQRVRIHADIELNDDCSNHRESSSQPYEDCQLLQLTDILVSGFRTVLIDTDRDAQWEVCQPLSALVEKWNRGRKGFSSSRWYKGFCISEGFLDQNGEWQFGNLKLESEPPQGNLFEF
jgi:hypothetical protein